VPSVLIHNNHSYKVVGSTSSPGFSEGVNTGYPSANSYNTFVSSLGYWPLAVANVTNTKRQLQVFPNPSKGEVTISFTGNDEKGQLRITDVQGSVVYKRQIKAQQQSIKVNTGNWAKGTYIVIWQSEDNTVLTSKLINL